MERASLDLPGGQLWYFSTELISKLATIKFSLNAISLTSYLVHHYQEKMLWSCLTSFSNYGQIELFPFPNGLRYMSYFLPYIQQTTYFSKTNLDSITSSLIRECCADSHTDFLTKSTHPLWLNLDVFITLPFKKKNEDNSPTEASHIGMNLEHP